MSQKFQKIISLFLMLLMIAPAAMSQRKKVAVVLGGGGAKGVAHIGVLKVLEEAGIPIDIVAGTSMGAIIGGLYSIGYSPQMIDSMVVTQDWTMLLSDRVKRNSQSFPEKEISGRYILSLPFGMAKKDRIIGGVIRGQNLLNLFSDLTIGYHDSVDFNKLDKPFACVSVDMVNGKSYVFHHGSLPIAMRSSMAIPAVFTPIRLDSMVLVDGGLNDNFPVDVAKSLGAEIIIGVDLGTSDLKKRDGLNNPADIIGQIIAVHGYDQYSENKKSTDLLIRPDVSPYTAASFTLSALDTLIHRGERAARNQWDEIIALKKKIGITDDEHFDANAHRSRPIAQTDSFYIRNIYFDGADQRDINWLHKLTNIHENSYITLHELRNALSILIGTNAYSNINYKLTGTDQQELHFDMQPKSISSLNLGVRFDSEEIMGILLNATFDQRHSATHSKFAFTGRVGSITSSARLDYSAERSPMRNFNFAYQFIYQDLDIFSHGDKEFNTSYTHHIIECGYSDMKWLNFLFKAGIRYEYFDYKDFLYTGENSSVHVKPEGYISYYAGAYLETFNHSYFPKHGVSLRADYSVYTDNFIHYHSHTPFSAVSVNFKTVIPMSEHLSLLPSIQGRVLIGSELAYPYFNLVGGEIPGHYLSQQMTFGGISHVEILNSAVVITALDLRQRISSNHYITLTGNYGIHHDDFLSLFHGNSIWGGRVSYAFNSIAGPINASFGISNRNKHAQFYINLGYYF